MVLININYLRIKIYKIKTHKTLKEVIKQLELPNRKTAKGSELIFISNIARDGSKTSDLTKTDMSHLNSTVFVLNSLSITNKTYIACEFNSYVVQLAHCT